MSTTPWIALRVSVRDDLYVYRCGWTTDGHNWAPVGCVHGTPREAADHSDRVVARRAAIVERADAYEPIGPAL